MDDRSVLAAMRMDDRSVLVVRAEVGIVHCGIIVDDIDTNADR